MFLQAIISKSFITWSSVDICTDLSVKLSIYREFQGT